MPDITGAALRLAIYARVSTEEQREGQTIDSQIAELERFSRDKGWPIVGIYKDEGWSGGVMERPDLDRLRDSAQKGVFDAVLKEREEILATGGQTVQDLAASRTHRRQGEVLRHRRMSENVELYEVKSKGKDGKEHKFGILVGKVAPKGFPVTKRFRPKGG